MKTNVYIGIGLRIIVLCAVGMLATFLPDPLREFFGDIQNDYNSDIIDRGYNWGTRHYWYFWMMFFLFILSVINVVMGILALVAKNYKD